jgi:hypothetical protein
MTEQQAYRHPMPKRPKPLLARPRNDPVDIEASIDRLMRRYPITMARLHEAELREAEEAERERLERGWE